jgi:hypothetical protein
MAAVTVTPAVATRSNDRPDNGWARLIIFALSIALLGFGIPGLLLADVPDVGRSSAWILAMLVAVWSGIRLSLLIAAGEARFFSYFFWLFSYIFMGIGPAVQIRSNRPSSTTPDVLPSLDYVALGIVILGLIAFEFGVFWGRAPRRIRTVDSAATRAAGPDAMSAGPSLSGTDIRPAAATLLALAGLAISAYYVNAVTVQALLTSREAAGVGRGRSWPDPPVRATVTSLAIYPALIASGALLLLRRIQPAGWAKSLNLLLAGSCIVLLLIAVNPISSARYTLGTVLFALAVLLGAGRTRTRIRFTLAACIFGLFVIFPVADAFRVSQRNFARNGFFGEYATNGDYDAFWQVANALTYWNSGQATVGYQAIGLPLFWLPRSIWAGKPLDSGIVLAESSGYTFTNLSAPLWAEALMNGGLVAVVITFVLAGLLLTRLDRRVSEALPGRAGVPGSGGMWVIVGAVFPAYLMILLRGSLLQATGAVAVIIMCLLVVRRRPRPARAFGRPPRPDQAHAP